jgi:hypothetical protein
MGWKAYQNLRKTIEAVPAGGLRDGALAQIGRLDCANPDKALATCDPAAPLPPPGVAGFQAAASDEDYPDKDYRKALVGTLKSIVCAGNDDSIFVLRGVSRELAGPTGPMSGRLAAAGAEAPAFIDFIMSPACPVSVALTNDDKARLLQIKREAIKELDSSLAISLASLQSLQSAGWHRCSSRRVWRRALNLATKTARSPFA